MPVWYAETNDLVEAGRLRLVGLIQEQHPDRCALFMQWKGLDFPILVDALNRTGVYAVPLYWAIDEHGVLRATDPKPEWVREEFVATDYPAPDPAPPAEPEPLDPAARHYLEGRYDEAIEGFMSSSGASGAPAGLFALGCAYRARWDSPKRRPEDFRRAVRVWGAALGSRPENYIWRRRLQQYGPLPEKPYPFYDWIETARAEIRERGEEPVALIVEPGVTETLGKANPLGDPAPERAEPDPEGRLPRDEKGLVEASVALVPGPPRVGAPFRVHLTFTPSAEHQAHWDNEAGESPQVFLKLPKGWRASAPVLAAGAAEHPYSRESRTVEFEVRAPSGETLAGKSWPLGYAVYYVCEEEGGTCQYLRQDLEVRPLGGG